MDGIKPPSGLQLSGDGANLKRFVQQFNLYLQAVNLEDAAESRKIALFLNCAGEDALEVYNTFSKNKVKDLQALIDQFKEYAEPRKNLLWLSYNLFNMKQQDGELFDNFYTKVLSQAKKCDLGELEDRLITMVIVIGIRDGNVKERLLRESELKLTAAIDICRAAELSKEKVQTLQGNKMENQVATSDRHNCQVAIKIISKFQAPGDYLKKFLPREIEVVKGLKHENLIRFLQAIETTHRVYIVMEYAENGSLLDIIRKDQHIDEVRGRRWFRQLVEAVDYCHERGVVHRDIKCENLLMDHGLNIKLSDFGFARGHMKPKNGVYALSETFCGSYAYASPEILKGVPYRPQDSDIWSMGVVLYAIVYGRLPFDDTNYTQLLKQVQNKVSFPREPKVSTDCRKLITKILAPLKVRVKIPQILADTWINPNQPAKDEEVDTTQENVPVSKEEIKSVNIGTVTFDRKLEEVK